MCFTVPAVATENKMGDEGNVIVPSYLMFTIRANTSAFSNRDIFRDSPGKRRDKRTKN